MLLILAAAEITDENEKMPKARKFQTKGVKDILLENDVT